MRQHDNNSGRATQQRLKVVGGTDVKHDFSNFDRNGLHWTPFIQPRWVGWRYAEPKVLGGRKRKVPIPGEWNESRNWRARSEVGDRAGFVLGYDSEHRVYYCGIDLDGCYDKDTKRIAGPHQDVNELARAVLERFKTLAEVSPSGKGIKLFFVLSQDDGRDLSNKTVINKGDHKGVVFDIDRYYTVTGEVLDDDHRSWRQMTRADVDWLLGHIGRNDAKGGDTNKSPDDSGSGYGDRWFASYIYHHGGIAAVYEEASKEIAEDEGYAGDWWRRVDVRQRKRAWQHGQWIVWGYKGADEPLNEWDAGDDPGPIPPRQWLLGNQFCIGFLTILVGAGGVGKSAVRLVQYMSLALGRQLSGEHIFRRARVLLLSMEDDHDELQRRIEAVLRHYQIDRADLKGWLICSNTRVKLAELKNRERVAGRLEVHLREAIERVQPDLIAFDPFVKLHSLSESDSGDMNFVCDLLTRVASDYDNAVDSVHHVHKGLILPGDPDAGRGSSGIRDAGRLNYTLTAMAANEATVCGIDQDDRHFYVRLDSAKVNTVPYAKAKWFRLVSVALNNGNETYPSGDHVQVAVPWSPPDVQAGMENVRDDILRAIDQGLGNGEYYTASGSKPNRAAWVLVQRFAQDKNPAQCRQIVRSLIKSGELVEFEYSSPKTRKPVKGLRRPK